MKRRYGFTVTRSGDLSAANAVAWAVAGSSASPANAADFTGGVLPSGTVSFAALGEASRTLSASVHGDTLVELNEGFVVTLSGPTNGAVLGTATANGLIQNDDTLDLDCDHRHLEPCRGVDRRDPPRIHPHPLRRPLGGLRVAWAVAGSGTSPANAADSPAACCPPAGIVRRRRGQQAADGQRARRHPGRAQRGLSVTLSGPTNGAALGTAAARGPIQNDDAA